MLLAGERMLLLAVIKSHLSACGVELVAIRLAGLHHGASRGVLL